MPYKMPVPLLLYVKGHLSQHRLWNFLVVPPLLPGFGESLSLLWPLFLEQGQGEQGASSQHCILRSQQKLGSEGKERLGLL